MLNLKSQNIVVLGSLNPAILQPNWLVRCGLIPEKKDVQYKFPIGAVIAPIQFKYDDFEWYVDYNKLQINFGDKDKVIDLGAIIANVFEDLQHTPVKAMGHNFVFEYKGELINSSHFSGLKLGDDFNGFGRIDDLSQEINLIDAEKVKIKIKLFLKGDMTDIHFNYHRDIKSVGEMIEFANSYLKNHSKSPEILNIISKREQYGK